MILNGDALTLLKTLGHESIQCCVTSPPYWGLRDYGENGQLGLEKTPEEYVQKMVEVFREVRRVLKKDGTLWLNLGDSYWGGKGQSAQAWSTENQDRDTIQKSQHQITGMGQTRPQDGSHDTIKPKDLVGIPWRVAFALQADGWWLRQDIIWAKPNPMPESVTDRCTKSHEYIFLLSKSKNYYYDAEAVKEKASYGTDLGILRGGKNSCPTYIKQVKKRVADGVDSRTAGDGNRNLRSVWTITTKPYPHAHFATFPEDIPERCIKAGTKKDDVVLDPFAGAGTTLEVAKRLGRKYIGIELNEKYVKELIEPRLESINPLFQ